MKAVLVTRFGPAAEVAEVAEVRDPGPPGPGQVLLDILAAPINPSDFLVFQGRFGSTPQPLPAPAGGEAVGQVAALGQGVTNLKIGDRILALHAGRGNWRQRVLAPAAGVRALPAGADPLQLAMLAVNPATALHMLTRYVTFARRLAHPERRQLGGRSLRDLARTAARPAYVNGLVNSLAIRQSSAGPLTGMSLDPSAYPQAYPRRFVGSHSRERGSPEPLMGCGKTKKERLWRAVLPAKNSQQTIVRVVGPARRSSPGRFRA